LPERGAAHGLGGELGLEDAAVDAGGGEAAAAHRDRAADLHALDQLSRVDARDHQVVPRLHRLDGAHALHDAREHLKPPTPIEPRASCARRSEFVARPRWGAMPPTSPTTAATPLTSA